MAEPIFIFDPDDLIQDSIQEALADSGLKARLDSIADGRQLSDDQRAAYFDAVRDVFLGRLESTEVAVALIDDHDLDFDLAMGLQDDLYEKVFDDLADQLDEQHRIYVDFHPEEFLPPEPDSRDADLVLAEGAVEGAGQLAPADPRLRERLVNIAAAHIKDVRDDAETLATLTKPAKTGGLGLGQDQAQQVLVFINAAGKSLDSKRAELIAERRKWEATVAEAKARKEERLKLMAPPASPEPRPEPVQTEAQDLMLADEDEDRQEIEEIKESSPLDEEAPAAGQVDGFLADRVDQAVADSGLRFKSGETKARFRTIVETLFRDLRDSLETRAKLIQSKETGGLGMKEEAADQVVAKLDAKAAAYRTAMLERQARAKADFVSRQQNRIMKESEERRQDETRQRDELFRRVTSGAKISVPTPGASAAASEAKLPPAQPIRPTAPKVIPVVGVSAKQEPVGQASPSAPPTQPGPVQPPAPRPPIQPARPAPVAMPAKSVPPPPAKSVPPAPPKALARPVLPRPASTVAPPFDLPSLEEIEDQAGPEMLSDAEHCQVEGQHGQPPAASSPRPAAGAGPAREGTAEVDILGLGALEKQAAAPPAAQPPTRPAVSAVSPAPKPPVAPPPKPSANLARPAPRPAGPPPKPAVAPTPQPYPAKPTPPPPPAAQVKPTLPAPPPPKPPAAPPPKPQPLPPKPAPPPPAVPPTDDKKVVSDVRFTPKLTGPVEELRQVSLADFRRLSKEPKEATLKIKDKIDLLADQSFETKSEGVKAWHDSEANKLYLELVRASLEGKPVVEAIAERERLGKPTLGKSEFDAIMELNRALRFG